MDTGMDGSEGRLQGPLIKTYQSSTSVPGYFWGSGLHAQFPRRLMSKLRQRPV